MKRNDGKPLRQDMTKQDGAGIVEMLQSQTFFSDFFFFKSTEIKPFKRKVVLFLTI